MYVSSDAASGTPHPAAAAVAAAADGDGMGVSGDTAPATSTDGGMPATLQVPGAPQLWVPSVIAV